MVLLIFFLGGGGCCLSSRDNQNNSLQAYTKSPFLSDSSSCSVDNVTITRALCKWKAGASVLASVQKRSRTRVLWPQRPEFSQHPLRVQQCILSGDPECSFVVPRDPSWALLDFRPTMLSTINGCCYRWLYSGVYCTTIEKHKLFKRI